MTGERGAGGGGAGVAAKHHGLDGDGDARAVANAVAAAMGDGLAAHPGGERGTYGAPELRPGRLWKRLAGLLLNCGLGGTGDLRPVGLVKRRAYFQPACQTMGVQHILEQRFVKSEHVTGIGVQQAAITFGRAQAGADAVVQPDIQDAVHQAGHGNGRG